LTGLRAVVRELLDFFDGVEDDRRRFDETPVISECVDDFRGLRSKVFRAKIDSVEMKASLFGWVTENMLFEVIVAKL